MMLSLLDIREASRWGDGGEDGALLLLAGA